ncbi:hypothetical protein BJV82DRAFT_623461 [Fennellomyces sp. T-0311]|nr:hypothetical protein BJV82DRAFT_623461 [Fennellomyces sp. T-0311]
MSVATNASLLLLSRSLIGILSALSSVVSQIKKNGCMAKPSNARRKVISRYLLMREGVKDAAAVTTYRANYQNTIY